MILSHCLQNQSFASLRLLVSGVDYHIAAYPTVIVKLLTIIMYYIPPACNRIVLSGHQGDNWYIVPCFNADSGAVGSWQPLCVEIVKQIEAKEKRWIFKLLFLKKQRFKLCVGVPGFEPGTSCSQSRRANRTALHPEVLSIAEKRCKGNTKN